MAGSICSPTDRSGRSCPWPPASLTWDEPGYVAQGIQQVDWLRRAVAGGAGADDPVWTAAHPDHPPLGKLVYGLAAVSRPRSHSAVTAARFVSALLVAVLVGLTAYAAARCCGETTAWLAGGSLLLTPQVLAHAQLARWISPPHLRGWLILTAATLPLAVAVGVVAGGWVLVRARQRTAWWIGLHLVFTLDGRVLRPHWFLPRGPPSLASNPRLRACSLRIRRSWAPWQGRSSRSQSE